MADLTAFRCRVTIRVIADLKLVELKTSSKPTSPTIRKGACNMGIVEIITVCLVLAKIFAVEPIAHWSWFAVLTPQMIALVVYMLIVFFTIWVSKR